MALIDVKQMVRDILDANDTHSIEGDLTDENECFDLAVEAAEKHIQPLPPVSVERDLGERLTEFSAFLDGRGEIDGKAFGETTWRGNYGYAWQWRKSHLPMLLEAARAITVLQARVDELQAFKNRILSATNYVNPPDRKERDAAIESDLRAGLSLRKTAAKHGATFSVVRTISKNIQPSE